eukprot:11227002-Lingulodinium_polyedra.AAC.1
MESRAIVVPGHGVAQYIGRGQVPRLKRTTLGDSKPREFFGGPAQHFQGLSEAWFGFVAPRSGQVGGCFEDLFGVR